MHYNIAITDLERIVLWNLIKKELVNIRLDMALLARLEMSADEEHRVLKLLQKLEEKICN